MTTEISDGNSIPSVTLPHAPFWKGAEQPRIVIGVTSDQTCLVLKGRLSALRLAGFAVTLVSAPGESLDRIAREEGVTAYPLSMRRGIAPFADFVAFLTVCRILLRLRPVITDFSTPKAGLLGNIAAWLLRIPHRVYTLRGLKLEGTAGSKRILLLWLERVAAWCAHSVLCNSTSLRSVAGSLRIAPRDKLHLLGDGSSNGVDLDRFSPGASHVRAELGIPPGDLVIGFVGRLTRDKGIPELLEAFEVILTKHPNCWLLLVGWFDKADDRLPSPWQGYIRQHPRIHHTGFVADTVPYYRAMNLFILPTRREGFPNAALEASACGLPVISTESTGARDAVIPEVTGLRIPPGVPEAIVEAALRLLSNQAMRKRMGEAGRSWVRESYSKDRVLGLAVQYYLELLKSE
jgi:glycosyltransferase involved in cell wall biosynthesis